MKLNSNFEAKLNPFLNELANRANINNVQVSVKVNREDEVFVILTNGVFNKFYTVWYYNNECHYKEGTLEQYVEKSIN